MTPDEIEAFLNESLTAILTTLGRDGWPHSTAMWFVPDENSVRMWTYAKSQKSVNLIRDSRFTMLAETGTAYTELRGVMVRGRVRILDDIEDVRKIGIDLHRRYVLSGSEDAAIDEGSMQVIEQQAHKRIGLVLPFDRIASWDHGKL